MTKGMALTLRWAWKIVDRSTAYSCAMRGVTYDPVYCHRQWELWYKLIDGTYARLPGDTA